MSRSAPSGRLVALLMSSLSATTQDRYARALDDLTSELGLRMISWSRLSHDDQDLFLAEWFAEMASDPDASPHPYVIMIAALHKTDPRLRFRLALKALEAWKSRMPIKHAPAMPKQLAWALATMALGCGFEPFACVLLLCFVGLLRVGEALALLADDLIFTSNRLVLHLRTTKRGRNEKVVIDDPLVIGILHVWWSKFDGFAVDPLFGLTYAGVARTLGKLCAFLQLSGHGFTTHSWRRGGASHLLSEGMRLEDICLHGRWASQKSAKLYIRQGELFVQKFRAECEAGTWNRVLVLARCLGKLYLGSCAGICGR